MICVWEEDHRRIGKERCTPSATVSLWGDTSAPLEKE